MSTRLSSTRVGLCGLYGTHPHTNPELNKETRPLSGFRPRLGNGGRPAGTARPQIGLGVPGPAAAQRELERGCHRACPLPVALRALDLRNHRALVQQRFYDRLMVRQITLKTDYELNSKSDLRFI